MCALHASSCARNHLPCSDAQFRVAHPAWLRSDSAPMKIIYATDLHGVARRYELLIEVACAEHAQAIVNGGDMLPTHGDWMRLQPKFLDHEFRVHLAQCAEAGIHFIGMLGNDDLRILDSQFDEIIAADERFHNAAKEPAQVNGYEFIGFNLVADYPFRLKDRCRKDSRDFLLPVQRGQAMFSGTNGPVSIENWEQCVSTLPTIQEELARLPQPHDPRKVILICHMPPSGLGLDVCFDDRQVGSPAVRDYIAARKPLLALHGHIHESPRMTGTWMDRIGDSVCVQPGQEHEMLVYVVIDLDTMEIDRREHPL